MGISQEKVEPSRDANCGVPRFVKGGTMFKEKLLHLLWYMFVYSPLTFMTGINIIILANERIIGGTFQVVRFRKRKPQIDKKKFNDMMKRITK